MSLSFEELQAGKDSAVIFDEMITDLKGITAANGTRVFPVDDWSDGSFPRTLLEAWSITLSRAYKSIPAITNGGFILLAPDSWIPTIARNFYRVEPFVATYTTGKLKYTVAAGNGPYSIQGGRSIASTEDRLRFFSTNTTPISISSATPVWIPIRAESPGAKYNVLERQINQLNTSLPGVTVENVPEGTDLSWVTNYGTDAESPAEIKARCLRRFGRLSKLQQYPEEGYISLVTDLVPQVKKVTVFTNYFQGTARPLCATLFLAGDSGAVAPAVVAQVLAAVRPYRCPLGTIFADSCTVQNQPVRGTVELLPDYDETVARSAIAAQLLDYQKAAQIGDRIVAAEVYERVMTPAGVKNYKPNGLFDFVLGANQVVNFQPSLDFITWKPR